MPTVEEVKLHIAVSIDEVDRAVLGIRGVTDRIDEALTRLRFTVAGSAHPRAADAIMRLEAARERLAEAQALAMGGVESAQAYHAAI